MKKFNVIYKTKLNETIKSREDSLLASFKGVYSVLLEKYSTTNYEALSEKYKNAFVAELAIYWNEKEGLTEKGKKFIETRSSILTESSTKVQKSNYFKTRLKGILNEQLNGRGQELKFKIYDVIDEMYKTINATNISDILSTDMISTIVYETFIDSLNEFTENLKTELSESAKPKRKFIIKKTK